MRITECRVNHVTEPMGYSTDRVSFSWKTEDARGHRQAGAKIRVWETDEPGKVVYDGEWGMLNSLSEVVPLSLRPRTAYSWTVSVRSDAGEEAVSGENRLETGKKDEPWTGKWISCDPGEPRLPGFCRRFSLERPDVRKARLYVSGLGVYEAHLNSHRIGDERLTPYCNNYTAWVQYQTWDVTPWLEGENLLEIALGNGWYNGRYGFTTRPGGGGFYGDRWKLIAELHVTYADGSEQVIASDRSWTVRRSRITFSSIYDGEHRDDTLPELPETQAEETGETLPLRERLSLPVRVQEERPAAELLHTPKDEWVYDLGQNLTGTFRLRVHEPRGTRIHVQVGEVLQDGCFYRENLRSAKAEYWYVSDGEEHVLEPKFTFYGYRYAKVEGITAPAKEDFTALVLYSDVMEAGQLTTGHGKINQLISNIRWGQKGNFLDVPTDCPQRDERMGWTADTQVFVPTACFFTDSAAFYRKFLFDLRTEQKQFHGMVPDVVPSVGHAGQGSSVWGDAGTIIPWMLYVFYGDKGILEESLESMEAWVDYIRREDGDHRGWGQHFHYGDWVALDHPTGLKDEVRGGTEDAFIAYVYYMYSARLTARAARVLGRSAEAEKYDGIADEVLGYIRDEYFTPNGRCAITTQTGYVLTLYYHLTGQREKALRSLKSLIRAKGNKFVTGFVGTPLIQRVLSAEGEDVLAYHILFNEEYPGWLYEVNLGATTIWERWNSMEADGRVSSTGMNSLNHYAYGSVGEWMWRTMAGLNPDPDAPGFRRVILRPVPHGKLGSLQADYDSPAGRYHVDWQVEGDRKVTLHVTVPFDCEVVLRLPWARDWEEKTLESGSYTFELEARDSLRPTYSIKDTVGDLLEDLRARKTLLRYLRVNHLPEHQRTRTAEDMWEEAGLRRKPKEDLVQLNAELMQIEK